MHVCVRAQACVPACQRAHVAIVYSFRRQECDRQSGKTAHSEPRFRNNCFQAETGETVNGMPLQPFLDNGCQLEYLRLDSQVDQTAKVSSSRPLHHLPTSLCLSLPLSARPICNCRRRRQMTLPGVVCTIWYLSGLSNGPAPPHSAPDPVHRVQRALHPLQGTCERVIRLRMPCT